jgi:CRP/FNR family nitrogen fixation transcriptional regulator
MSERPTRGEPASRRDPLAVLGEFAVPLHCERDTEIYAQDDPAEHCYRVVSGGVRIVKLMEDGRRHVAEFLLAGDLFGFDALATHDYAAQAITATEVRRYPRHIVERLTEQDSVLAGALRMLTIRKLRQVHDRVLLLGYKTTLERLAAFLLEMTRRGALDQRGHLALPMNRKDIADHLGMTLETVSRNFTQLRRDRLIEIDRSSHIEIRDRRGLARVANAPRR